MKSCKQCGTCCRKGGPALHANDLNLLKKKIIPITTLVSLREGEPVFSPLSGTIEPAEKELVKLSATNSWCCPFLQTDKNQCSIYQHRPVECKLLKCWDTAGITEIIFQNVLNRWDIIDSDNPLWQLIKLHDKECAFGMLQETKSETKKEQIIARDLALREQAINKFNISLQEELFYFGRPMFKSLDFFKN